MPIQGPLLVLRSKHHSPYGLAPPSVLVEAAADSGYRILALGDEETLAGVPEFLDACRKRSLAPLVGMQVRLRHPHLRGQEEPYDVLSLGYAANRPGPTHREESVLLLALNRSGYRSLLDLHGLLPGPSSPRPVDRLGQSLRQETFGLTIEELIRHQKGLFLVVGLPGTLLEETVSGKRRWSEVSWLGPLLSSWPKRNLAFGGLLAASGEDRLAIRLDRLKHLPLDLNLSPIALGLAAFRNHTERFWGCAAADAGGGAGHESFVSPGLILQDRERTARSLTGLSRAMRLAERLATKDSDLSDNLRCTPPVYPTPRGTDIASFFWTLVQETAIATGHIRTPGGKERLYEEFQYLKQTDLPLVWSTLWDLRRRLGLPPGTFRPCAEWTGTSLFAHLLGMTRIDPLRARIPFHPDHGDSPAADPVRVEVPQGWSREIIAAIGDLFGEGHARPLSRVSSSTREGLSPAGSGLMDSWERLEFPGDKPSGPPPFPSYLPETESAEEGGTVTLLLSGSNLSHSFPSARDGTGALEIDFGAARLMGGVALEFQPSPAQTLAAANRYRPAPDEPLTRSGPHESLTEWIESHKGKIFHGRAYADDSGRIEVLGRSSNLLRLLSLPGSSGFRPLLYDWIRSTGPKSLGELADFLALNWHWSYWGQRPEYRLVACRRGHPLRPSADPPPWWPEWERFLETSGLESRSAGKLSSALEKEVGSTGGWLLYREQLDLALENAWGFSPGEREVWLGDSVEEESGSAVWKSKVRIAFVHFLGQPRNLPSRVSFYLKAERLLAAADAFHLDPAAVTVLVSILFPEEAAERKEVYTILREEGIRLDWIPLPDGSGFDSSESKQRLSLGYLNILGVGPQVVQNLTRDTEASRDLRSFFKTSPPPLETTWEEVLPRLTRHPIHWQVLTRAIRLGLCDRFGLSRERLAGSARGYLERRLKRTRAVQQTLFSLEEAGHEASVEERTAWVRAADREIPLGETEMECLRFGAQSSLLRAYAGRLPEVWLEKGEATVDKTGRFLAGWVLAVDLFQTVEDTLPPRLGFLLHTPASSYRLTDRSGALVERFPEPLPEPLRLDGHRLLLKQPWFLFCRAVPLAEFAGSDRPVLEVLDFEALSDLERNARDWAGLTVRLESATPELLGALEALLKTFEGAGVAWTVPLHLEVSPRIWRSGPAKRLAKRLGNPEVLASRLLVSSLEGIKGIESVEIRPRQQALFGQGEKPTA